MEGLNMKKICKQSFIYSLAAAAYIALVAIFMANAEKFLGKNDTALSALAFLLLFSLSALIVGALLVGKPLMIYLDGKKKEAVWALLANAGWMLLFLIISLAILMLIK